MKKILFASNNENKIMEMKDIIKDYEVLSLKDVGINIDIPETGTTFEENAFIKADTIFDIIKDNIELKNIIILADDSGIEIDYLDGNPGIYSARWMPDKNSSEVNEEIIKKLADAKAEERNANYVTCIACIMPDGKRLVTKGYTYGIISKEEKGTNGFAYDRIFFLPEYNRTMAEITIEEKNEISHRAIAIEKMKDLL